MDRTCGFLLRGAIQAVAPSGATRKSEGGFVGASVGRRCMALTAVTALAALSACANGGGEAGSGAAGAAGSKTIGVILPLSGPNAALGSEMLAAARLAVTGSVSRAVGPQGHGAQGGAGSSPGALQIDAHDTATTGGAAAAMQAALASGDGIILGPLTGADTGQISAMARQAGTPMLAFTSDVAQAQPGVWILGVTPEQQVDRLVSAAQAEGRRQFAAFLPDNPLGRALGEALSRSCQARGLAPAQIVYHATGADAITTGVATLSAYQSRVDAANGAASGASDALPPDLAAALNHPPGATSAVAAPRPLDGSDDTASAGGQSTASGAVATPAATAPAELAAPPFDALLLGDTGLALKSTIDALAANKVTRDKVRIMGPGLWAAFAGKLGGLAGAWYAAPDPANRRAFVQAFVAQTHRTPKPLADLAYDAGALAGAVNTATGGAGYPISELTRQQGFAGVDGVFALTPDGRTTRELAIFEVQTGGGSRLVSAAARRTAPAPGAS
ncbi:penicillin-binding protein activator [Acetobacter nitrogenifigens]|nr:penicillin-binding protein activator [Acetobacter nitrogenifigens]